MIVKTNDIGKIVYLTEEAKLTFAFKSKLPHIKYGIIIEDKAVPKNYCRVCWYSEDDEICQTKQKIGYWETYDLISNDSTQKQPEKLKKTSKEEFKEEFNRRYEEKDSQSLIKPQQNEPDNKFNLSAKIATIKRAENITGYRIQGSKHAATIAKGCFRD